jgi:hypothetical protein
VFLAKYGNPDGRLVRKAMGQKYASQRADHDRYVTETEIFISARGKL